MGFLDGFLNKMNFSTTDEYDGDYDDMDMTEENEEEEEETQLAQLRKRRLIRRLQRQSLHQLLLQQPSARSQQKIPQARWFL